MSRDRRREGPRTTIATVDVTPLVRVTAHPGDQHQPPMVRIWSGDGGLVWSCAAELDEEAALCLAVAVRSAAWTLATRQEEAA